MLHGVEHFYLYNNNSTDNYMDVLEEYIQRGIVSLIDWPEIPGQISAYKHWYNTYREETQWVCFLDLDEYICPRYDVTISEWLTKYDKYPVIIMYWLMFGSSGRLKHDVNIPLIEQYTHCWSKLYNVGKQFYNTDFEIAGFYTNMMHLLNVKWKGIIIPPFNDSGNALKWEHMHYYNAKKCTIQVNHYWSRAYDMLLSKITRGSAAYEKTWKNMQNSMQQEQNDKSRDYTIFRYLLALKVKLSKKYSNESTLV